MNTLLDIIRSISPWAFLVLCVFSYFSGMLLALVVRAIKRTSWEGASAGLRLAYRLVRGFRAYASPGDDDLDLDSAAPRGSAM